MKHLIRNKMVGRDDKGRFIKGHVQKGISGDENPAKRPEVRKKISEALKGRKLSDKTKEKIRQNALIQFKNGMLESTKKKISKGIKLSEIYRESLNHRSHPPNLGQFKLGFVPFNKGKSWEEYYGREKAEWMRENLNLFKKGNIPTYPSSVKGKTYEEIFGVERAREIKEKQSESRIGFRTGELCHFWNGGTSREPYSPEFNVGLKKIIRKRDNYTCLICNKPENGRRHQVHHIDYDKTNIDPLDLMTLCLSCHMKTNCNREYWEELLSEIMGVYK